MKDRSSVELSFIGDFTWLSRHSLDGKTLLLLAYIRPLYLRPFPPSSMTEYQPLFTSSAFPFPFLSFPFPGGPKTIP